MNGRGRGSFVLLALLVWVGAGVASAYPDDTLHQRQEVLEKFLGAGLREQNAYRMLQELTRRAPHRLSGSAGADTAVNVTRQLLLAAGADTVWTEPCMVPHWERGKVERAVVTPFKDRGATFNVAVCALGGSVATPRGGVSGEIVEVHTFEELRSLGDGAKGKIVFFNRPMDAGLVNTFEAYGRAVDQRSRGAIEAARVGARAAIVRSMTLAKDNVPHTGVMGYQEGVLKIPAAAIGIQDAERLSELLRRDPRTRLTLTLDCRTLPDAPSANVIGEIRGREYPNEIILVGGHLDSWDKGAGAHDDGSGCIHAIEVVHLFRKLGIVPRRTIRAVMFMNEENGSRGGAAYAVSPARARERHLAAIESDRGGFAPRGFTIQADSTTLQRILRWKPLFQKIASERFAPGSGGVDVTDIVKKGAVGIGLDVDDYRYFDFHHSANDVVENVHPRELELGAIAAAFLCYLLAEEGLAP
jgi:carboxypeptidase Q